MSSWKVKRGNTSKMEIPVRDKNGDLVTNLADAEEIKFQVKESKTATAVLIEKGVAGHFSGAEGIDVNQPETGYLRVTVLPTDTDETPDRYVMALQIKWDEDNIYEVILKIDGVETHTFEIEQDIIQ